MSENSRLARIPQKAPGRAARRRRAVRLRRVRARFPLEEVPRQPREAASGNPYRGQGPMFDVRILVHRPKLSHQTHQAGSRGVRGSAVLRDLRLGGQEPAILVRPHAPRPRRTQVRVRVLHEEVQATAPHEGARGDPPHRGRPVRLSVLRGKVQLEEQAVLPPQEHASGRVRGGRAQALPERGQSVAGSERVGCVCLEWKASLNCAFRKL
uniref:(northern house mosquito) hypothetical protein n=1 Tax=Culex pipiens TaxID=7175 RepID=A0A8D8ESH1_CULPI